MPKPREIKIVGDLAYVPLTRGYTAIIDAADVPLVAGCNWAAQVRPHTVYATTNSPRPQRRKIMMHRVIAGEPAGMDVDHRDGNGLNNTRSNLRAATRSQNLCNQRPGRRNASGLKGVSWHKRLCKWRVRITIQKRSLHVGVFETLEEARAAYAAASKAVHGEYGRAG